MPFLRIARELRSLLPYSYYPYPSVVSRPFSSTAVHYARQRFRNPRMRPSKEEEEIPDDSEFLGDDTELPKMPQLPNLKSMGVNLLDEDLRGKGSRSEDLDGEIKKMNNMRGQFEKEKLEMEKQIAKANAIDTKTDAEIRGLFSEQQREDAQDFISNYFDSGFFDRPYQIEVDYEEMPKSAIVHLINFNQAMETSRLAPQDNKARLNLWRAYERAKLNVPDFLSKLPKNAWTFIWQGNTEDSPSNPNRLSHLKVLANDMVAAEIPLSQVQRFARVEGHFLDGDHSKALELWEAGLKDGDAGSPDYIELGIRMYSRVGNIARAEELLEVLYKLYTIWDPRIIKSVLMACIKLGSEQRYAQAFGLYLRLRDRLARDMAMEDYDQISTGFLSAGQRDYALAVFRDMILAGNSDYTNDIYEAIKSSMGSFISLARDAEEVNRFSLESLSFLPRIFQNKFFYASWMRKLIAMGHVDDAAQVAELMVHRGVKLDPMHANGLISGWFRSADEESLARAEKLGWSMIQTRLHFVRQRRLEELARMGFPTTELDVPEVSVFDHEKEASVPALSNEWCPPATIETFSLLVQWYLRRGKFGNVRHLRNLLVPAEIKMNSFFMNHLLYAELRNRTHRDVWARFEVMSRNTSPDLETFTCLWECMRVHVDPVRNQDPTGYPTPRELFARMGAWFRSLTGQQLTDAQADINQDLYDEIIQCFCFAHDIEGSLVALQALKDMWGLVPQTRTLRLLIIQIARLKAPHPLQLWKPSFRKSRQISASQSNKERMANVTRIFEIIVTQRRDKMQELGIKFEDLDQSQQEGEKHRAILQLLFTAMMEMHGEAFDGAQAINNAAQDIGIGDIDVEQLLALDI